MKKIISVIICAVIMLTILPTSFRAAELYGEAKSVILMEASTGEILYEHNADQRLPPASVTKIMTILLTVEELDKGTLSLSDTIQVSERASKMGGSQVYLKAGEMMSVEDLLKSVIVASANDASTALAEHIAGSVEEFVRKMNERASQLGMTNTVFENPTGLDDSVKDHLTTARDIALMSAELLKHPIIFNYTTIWMDTIRDGAFGLTNTNRLIRFYKGATGLKTGSTSKAGFCISATAERDGMHLIAVVMGSPNRDSRNETAKALLDYGFSAFRYYKYEQSEIGNIDVLYGVKSKLPLIGEGFGKVLPKDIFAAGVTAETVLPKSVKAPIKAGDKVGEIIFKANGEEIGKVPIRAAETVEKISFSQVLKRLISSFFSAF
ncbi:MAG: D-alanyl-D-alanine carboxypeptidase [Clostridia bacterium]|nr:D-alanyl-D-alanine carboxypeptidase [Clostridia bacterium]